MATALTTAAPLEIATPAEEPGQPSSTPRQWQNLRLFGRGRHETFEAGSERKGEL
jgi:hypothetical protein